MSTPDFVVELRRHVGHASLWLPGVTAVVLFPPAPGAPVWEVPRVLLVRRADSGWWTPVTGILEPGEEPGAGAVREVLEETGLRVRPVGLVGVGATGEVEYPNGDRARFLDTTLRCELDEPGAEPDLRVPPEPRVGDAEELVEVGWFSISQLPPLQPRFRLVIGDAAAQLRHPQGFRPRVGYVKRQPGQPL